MAYATKQWIFFWSVSLGLTGMEEGAATFHDMLYRKVDQQGSRKQERAWFLHKVSGLGFLQVCHLISTRDSQQIVATKVSWSIDHLHGHLFRE